jgi:hypothetical protein
MGDANGIGKETLAKNIALGFKMESKKNEE